MIRRPEHMDRRAFVRHSAVAGLGAGILGAPAIARSRNLNDVVSVAVVGVNSRGGALAEAFARSAGADVVAICDVDARATEKTVAAVSEVQARSPHGMPDSREALTDVCASFQAAVSEVLVEKAARALARTGPGAVDA